MLFKQENKKFVVREDGTEREIKVCKHIRYANDYVRRHSNVHVSVENAPLPTPTCGECVVYLALWEEGGCTLKEACYNHCYKCSKGGI